MNKFGNIYLSWRKGPGSSRHLVGVIKNNATNGVSFQYLPENKIQSAKEDGFQCYTEFPNSKKKYNENVLEIFKQRLFRSERTDYKSFLEFWNIDEKYKDDTLYLLAHTQGLVPTDNFEFLADFKVTKDLQFVSDIAGLTYSNVPTDSLKIGDEIVWKKSPSEFDKYQVDLYTLSGVFLGHIKKIHSKIFYDKRALGLKLKTISIEKNGTLKRAFIRINN